MAYIRIRKHYVHLPYLLLGVIEALLLAVVAYSVQQQLLAGDPEYFLHISPWGTPVVFSALLSCCTLSMGVYGALAREGYVSILLRTLVSFFLLGSAALYVLSVVLGRGFIPQAIIFWGVILATLVVLFARYLFVLLVDRAQLQRRVVVYGAGMRAQQLLQDLAPQADVAGVKIIGTVARPEEPVLVDASLLIAEPVDWVAFVKKNQVSEILIAPDERRSRNGQIFPLSQFLDCKLAGVPSCGALDFYERELGRVDINLLQPSWMLFSDGFNYSKRRSLAKRLFDVLLASVFLLLLWPLMLLTAIAVRLDSPGPVLYHQVRVGLNGRHFRIYKFRSMRQDAEKNGAMWAQKNDARVTRVGSFIRNTRLDELPQLYNVFAGQMSFVGPRPERPEFVDDLEQQIPFYAMRHKVKPGLMGWAQLKYPYGASVEDAKNKLQYDLYYTKNHSFLMDMLILIQTVEIILLGKGVR